MNRRRRRKTGDEEEEVAGGGDGEAAVGIAWAGESRSTGLEVVGRRTPIVTVC